ncbi:hypothetical protein [Acinetobacter pittii]|uniref:hypothetical protein n=1 Tax=Acinetobacter pittii TaxID=48296 RepID=UPI002A756D36|nr:hypothetical protein [Acinetobacter pittii]WPP87801.1 hypothetical protein SOI77_15760 [Acinetobacter pittii]
MKVNTTLYPQYLASEFIVAFISSIFTLSITYYFDGSSGVIKILDSANGKYSFTNLIALGILFIISIILFVIYRLFNPRNKPIYKRVGNSLYDLNLSLLRVGGGFLVAFPFLYIFTDGFNSALIKFFFFGFCALAEAAGFSLVRDSIEPRLDRPIQYRK